MEHSDERGLEGLNSVEPNEAENEFLKCCGSNNWARAMAADRPFLSLQALLVSAARVWWSLEQRDWLEAFRSHPKIGEKRATADVAIESQKWSEAEQSGIRDSGQETLDALAQLNREYKERFGYIFIVCASGKTSEEMLQILRQRLGNDTEEELRIAAAEQAKITQLRLTKLIEHR